MAYIYGRGDGRPERDDDEPDLTPAIAGPIALATLIALAVSVALDSYTEDSPWTAGGAAIFACLVAVVAATVLSFRLARRIGAAAPGALFAAVMVALMTPIAVVGGYVVLSMIGA